MVQTNQKIMKNQTFMHQLLYLKKLHVTNSVEIFCQPIPDHISLAPHPMGSLSWICVYFSLGYF